MNSRTGYACNFLLMKIEELGFDTGLMDFDKPR